MKVSLNWIKQFTKITLPPQELRDRISVSLTEVEGMEEFGDRYKEIVAAKVEHIDKHPTSDILLVLTLDVGERHAKVVVQRCPVKVGDMVPYLAPGVLVPGDIGVLGDQKKVVPTSVKGMLSDGMVPSGREIGLNNDHTTVYQLPRDAKPGEPVNQILELVDQIIEIKNKSLTHRPDVFSTEGLAREVAAIQGTAFKPLKWLEHPQSIKPAKSEERLALTLVNDAKGLCPRYMAVVLDNVRIADSPPWLQITLAKHGLRPVNNVVDISNYLMLEVGQPNHAFDYDKVIAKDPQVKKSAIITVRLARGGEKITTIDGQVKDLFPDTVVIADSTHPIGIAGIMGGKDTEISSDTKRVIFQVENIDMYSIRRSSMKLGLFTDAVTRFSKGIDPNRCEPVLYRGIQMLQQLTGCSIASVIYDHYRKPVRPRRVSFSLDGVRARIGTSVSDKVIEKILVRLNLRVVEKRNGSMTVEVPTWRPDISIPQDIDEEVVRIYGYDKVVPVLPSRMMTPIARDSERVFRLHAKDALKNAGAVEVYTYSFVGASLYEHCGLDLDRAHRLINALSPELEYMRPVLVPSLLDKVRLNFITRGACIVFEIDKTSPIPDGSATGPVTGALPDEPWHLGFVHARSYYDAKLYIETVLRDLQFSDGELVPKDKTDNSEVPAWIAYAVQSYNLSRVAYIRIGKQPVGVIGQIRQDVCSALDIPQETSACEIDMSALFRFVSFVPTYRDPSRFPSVVHDFCFVVDADVPYAALVSSIQGVDEKKVVLKKIECVDIYRDSGFQDVKKVTVRVTMQRDDRTLDEQDVNHLRDVIVKEVKKRVNGELAE